MLDVKKLESHFMSNHKLSSAKLNIKSLEIEQVGSQYLFRPDLF